METGCPQKLVGTDTTIYFNDLSDAQSYGGLFKIDRITGADGSEVRTAYEPRPQRDGGITHPFYRSGRAFTLEGTIIANTVAARTTMEDLLRGVTQTILRDDGYYRFTPKSQSEREFICRLAGAVEIFDIDSALKSFTLPLYSENAYGRSVAETLYTITPNGTATITNAGNAPYWPICLIYGPLGTFTLENQTTGLHVHWDGHGHLINNGDFGYMRMDFETLTLNTVGGASELRYVDFSASDFWSLDPGSNVINFDASSIGGATKVKVYAHNGWV